MIKNLLLLFLLLFIHVSNQPVCAQGVDLSKLKSIRVWLFSDKSISEVKVKATYGDLKLVLDNRETIVQDYTFVTINQQGSSFRVSFNNKRVIAKEIEIRSTTDSLINVITKEAGYKYYHGSLLFNSKTKLKPINTVSLDDYVASVVGSEMNFTNQEALKVQAVISRTYALWNLGSINKGWYDVTDHTMSQVYNGEAIEKPWFRDAALATKGEVALFNDKIILAVFSSTCGGVTSNNESTWSGRALPYLRGHTDHDACKSSPHYEWRFALSSQQWKNWINQFTNSKYTHLKINSYTSDGRVEKLGLKNSNSTDSDYEWKANDFRLKMIRSFGAKSLKSTLFSIVQNQDSIIFNGKGMGHGIGVCQWGALGLADAGWNYKDILRFYYGGIEIKNVYFDVEKTFLELAN